MLDISNVVAAALFAVLLTSSGCGCPGSTEYAVSVDRSSPLALARSYHSAACRRDFGALLSCVASDDRAGISALLEEMRVYHARLPRMLELLREQFGPEMARDVRERMLGGLPSPFQDGAATDSFDQSCIRIIDQGDLALYEIERHPRAKAKLFGDQWYFIVDDDGYGRWLVRNPMAEAIYRDASDEMERVISELRRGSLCREDVERRLLQ
jgi:hypothetical protein